MPNHRPFKNYPDAELYSLVIRLEEELEATDSPAAHKQLALVEDEIETREWD